MYVIGFGANDSPSSLALRLTTGGWCSHTWLEIDDEVLHVELKGGVHVDPLERVLAKYPVRCRFVIRNDLRPGLQRAAAMLGEPWALNCTSFVADVLLWSGVTVPETRIPIELYTFVKNMSDWQVLVNERP